jgi:hypothetical protein
MSSAGTLRVQDVGLLNLIARRVWSPDGKSAITFRKQGGTGLKYQVFVWSWSEKSSTASEEVTHPLDR